MLRDEVIIIGIFAQPDPLNVLLPRSTGLHYTLRSLAPRMPSLKVIDITMMYPGTFMDAAILCKHLSYPGC
jgi:hypothetical protein